MNKSEQLIACLEGEIAKRDEELAACRVAVENCEVFRARIAELEADRDSHQRCAIQTMAELSALKAQEPVEYQLRALIRDVTNIPEAGYYMPQSWHDQVIALSLSGKLDAPVSEAKAQGVVQWPEADEIMQMAFEEGQPADDASGYCFELEEFDLFIERLMSDVARLNAAPVQQVSVPACVTCCDVGIVGHSMLCPECNLPPAAPAADAGLVDMYRHLQTVTPYRFKKIQDASITDGGDVMYFHKDRFDAALLADMAAHSAKGVV